MKFKFKFWYMLVVLGLILVAGGGWFYTWAQETMGPGEQALLALEAEGDVTVTVGEEEIVFQPINDEPDTALIFYPGGKVDYRSYARPLRQVASRGFLVISVRAPLNLMVFAPNKAEEYFPQYPNIKHWVVGGHSLGGAMAAQYAGNHTDKVDGLVLWAAYPSNWNNLKDSGLRALSVYGTLDMAGVEPFENSKDNMPERTTWVIINNGNHSQFGDYGLQPGDSERATRDFHQQALTVAATEKFLRSLSE
jgi:pimeloyl-ACP methyl ester carboxylesterase